MTMRFMWEPSWQPFLFIEGEEEASAGGGGSGEITEQQQTEATEQQTETTETPPVETKPTPAPPPDWRDKRIAQLRAQLTAEQQKNRATPPPATPTSGLSEADVEARANARATELAAAADFNRQCEATALRGKAEFQDWDTRIAAFRQLASPDNPSEVAAYNQLLIAAMETGEGEKIIHRLAGDLNEASRLMTLPPVKMAVEIARMSTPVSADVSKVPNPIRPVTTRGPSHTAIDPADPDRADNLDVATWMKRRTEQVRANGDR